MIFSSFQFLIFFLIVLLSLIIIPGHRWPKLALLIASYYFYASWDYRFVPLLFAATVLNFLVGAALYNTKDQTRQKLLLLISIVVNLTTLGVFKYYNFFIDSARVLVSSWGLGVSNLEIILPLGISFYTFEAISYVVDIYRGKLKPADSFEDFALFIAFFPHLVAGPIVRAADFLPQLKLPIRIKAVNVWDGSQIFIIGLFKKLMVADAVAPFVDRVFAYPDYFSSTTVWLAVLAYALQIYCDFSGYTDMGIGCARILGLHLNRNFNMPYLSRNVTEFWRRWHISLSSWLRDYLYISLGGSRKGEFRTYINLMLTMLLGGLWHGASWNFVIWGALHGFALAFHRLWSGYFKSVSLFAQVISVIITFLFVSVVWVLFRAQDTQTMLAVYSKMAFVNPAGATWYYYAAFAAIAWSILGHVVGSLRANDELIFFETPYSYRAAFVTLTVLLIIYVFAPTEVNPFIYFQF